MLSSRAVQAAGLLALLVAGGWVAYVSTSPVPVELRAAVHDHPVFD